MDNILVDHLDIHVCFLFQVSVWSQLVLLYDELFSFGFGYDYRQTHHFVLHEYLLTPRFFLEHLRGLYLDDSTWFYMHMHTKHIYKLNLHLYVSIMYTYVYHRQYS